MSSQQCLLIETTSSQQFLFIETMSSQQCLLIKTTSSQQFLLIETISSQQCLLIETTSEEQLSQIMFSEAMSSKTILNKQCSAKQYRAKPC